jgi:hypothetical protein
MPRTIEHRGHGLELSTEEFCLTPVYQLGATLAALPNDE